MTRANRDRGARAERAVVAWLREHGWPECRRTLAGDGRQDTDVCGVSGVSIEVKDVAESRWPSWCAQAFAQRAADAQVVVVVRRTRGVTDVGSWAARWCRPAEGDAVWTWTTFADAIETATNHMGEVARA